MPEFRHPSGLFKITTSGVIEQILARIKNRRALWLAEGKAAREGFRQAFERGGPGWQPLAESTVAAKSMMGFPRLGRSGRIPLRLVQNGQFGPRNILIRTGALRDAASRMNVRGNLTRIGDNSAEFGVRDSVIPYAKYHQGGTRPYTIRPRRAKSLAFIGVGGTSVFARIVHHPGLPPRPFIEVTAESLKKYARIALDWMVNFGHDDYHEGVD